MRRFIRTLSSERGEGSTRMLLELLIAAAVCAAVISVLKPAFPGLVSSLCGRMQTLFGN